MKKTTLLDQFEQLPELREQEEISTGKTKVRIARQIAWLIEQEPIVRAIFDILASQRATRDDIDLTMDIRPIDPIRRADHISGLRHSIVNFAQRAFSLPTDYRITNAEWESRRGDPGIIESIVIQPEYLSDDFMIGLGYMTEEDRRISLGEKVTKKIQAIPHIKNLLRDLRPLSLQPRMTTGRISLVENPENPNFGKYVVFQETTDIEDDNTRKRRRKIRNIIPRVYDDIYSLMRGQRHALDSLEKKIEFLSVIKDSDIPELSLKWKNEDYTDDQKRTDIAILVEKLKKKISYSEKRALEDRIREITFDHAERDCLRLIGACNDLIRETQEKIEKNAEISRQLEWLKHEEKAKRIGFEKFYEELLRDVEAVNAVMIWVDPQGMSEDEVIEWIQANRLNKLWQTVQNYMRLPHFAVALWYPFQRIAGDTASHVIAIKNHRGWPKGPIRKEGLRITLSLILAVKEIRYTMIMKEAEHRMRVRGEGMTEGEKSKLASRLHTVWNSLEGYRFLPEVDLRESGQEKFEAMIQAIRNLEAELSGK